MLHIGPPQPNTITSSICHLYAFVLSFIACTNLLTFVLTLQSQKFFVHWLEFCGKGTHVEFDVTCGCGGVTLSLPCSLLCLMELRGKHWKPQGEEPCNNLRYIYGSLHRRIVRLWQHAWGYMYIVRIWHHTTMCEGYWCHAEWIRLEPGTLHGGSGTMPGIILLSVWRHVWVILFKCGTIPWECGMMCS